MGRYIQGPATGKVQMLVNQHSATIISLEEAQANINNKEKGIVVVVDNGMFEAAGFCPDRDELKAFSLPTDYRPKTFLMMDRQKAEELAN